MRIGINENNGIPMVSASERWLTLSPDGKRFTASTLTPFLSRLCGWFGSPSPLLREGAK